MKTPGSRKQLTVVQLEPAHLARRAHPVTDPQLPQRHGWHDLVPVERVRVVSPRQAHREAGGETVVRSSAVSPRDAPAYEFGPYRLLSCGTLVAGNESVPLTPKEEGVLRVLVAAEGHRVSKDALVEAVWREVSVADASLARAVHTLRRRLGCGRDGVCYIRTSYGRGYQLSVPVRRVE
jgi:DNA-binding winged helix-turn-helix (wHTH) protein